MDCCFYIYIFFLPLLSTMAITYKTIKTSIKLRCFFLFTAPSIHSFIHSTSMLFLFTEPKVNIFYAFAIEFYVMFSPACSRQCQHYNANTICVMQQCNCHCRCHFRRRFRCCLTAAEDGGRCTFTTKWKASSLRAHSHKVWSFQQHQFSSVYHKTYPYSSFPFEELRNLKLE